MKCLIFKGKQEYHW